MTEKKTKKAEIVCDEKAYLTEKKFKFLHPFCWIVLCWIGYRFGLLGFLLSHSFSACWI